MGKPFWLEGAIMVKGIRQDGGAPHLFSET